MFTLPIKYKYKDIEQMMDDLMEMPHIYIKDIVKARRLGSHASDLRNMKLLHISHDTITGESICSLKCNNFYIPGNVTKVKDKKKIKYVFDFTNIPKL